MEDMEKKTCGCGHDHEHGEDCGCGHDHQYMTLRLEDDTEVRCIVIGTFEVDEYEGKEYIALVSEDGEESFIYEYRDQAQMTLRILAGEAEKFTVKDKEVQKDGR